MVNDPIQDLRDVAANVTANPHHVAIIAAAAVLHLANEFATMKALVYDLDLKYAHPLYTVDSNGARLGIVRDTLDHILDETE